jgi:hypothetical protein
MSPLLDMFSQLEALVSSATSLVVRLPCYRRACVACDALLCASVQNARLPGRRSSSAAARWAACSASLLFLNVVDVNGIAIEIDCYIIFVAAGNRQLLTDESSRLAAASVVGIGKPLPLFLSPLLPPPFSYSYSSAHLLPFTRQVAPHVLASDRQRDPS